MLSACVVKESCDGIGSPHRLAYSRYRYRILGSIGEISDAGIGIGRGGTTTTTVHSPSWPKLKRVPDGDVMLEPGENGEFPTESCSPLVECERSQSRASSWLRSWADGVYLRREIEVEGQSVRLVRTATAENCGECVAAGTVFFCF